MLKLRNELARAERKIEALEHELGKLNRITEMVKDLVIMTDDNGIIRQSSHALNSTLGFNIQDLRGMRICDLVHPDDKLAFEVFLKKLNSKHTSTLLHRITTKSGKYTWIETSCLKSIKKGSELVFYLRDLSDKMKLQNDLLLSHQRYKSLVENMPFVLFRYDKDLKHIFVSSNVSELLPFEPEEILGSDFNELGFHREKVDFFKGTIQKVFETGKKTEKEFQQETQRGLLSLVWRLIPEYDDNGTVNTVLGILEDVTELKKIQREKQSSEEKFKHIFNTIPDSVVLSRFEDGLLLDVNEGFLRFTGYRKEEVINRSSLDIQLFKDKEGRSDFIEKLKKGPIINEELKFQTKNKKEVEVLISSSPIHLFGDDLLISIFRDISEIKENQRRLSETILQLQRTEEKFDSFIEQSPDGIALTDEVGLITNWNKSMEDFSGFERNKAIGKKWHEVLLTITDNNNIEEKKYDEHSNLIKEFIEDKHSHEKELKFQSALDLPGRGILYLENLLFKIDVKGKFRHGLISRDITQEKKNHDQALLYKDIFDKNEDGIAILNNDGTYREVNMAYTRIVGYGIDELKGKDSSVILGKKLYTEVFKVYEFQNIFDGELRATTLDKKKIYLDYLLFPVKSGEETLCIVQIIRDITERKEAEQNLIEAKRRAEDADKLKTAFLSNMSHEIRTPMNSILGFSTLLENPNLSEQQRLKYIEFINKNGENLLNLIGDIIDIAKIESNQLRIKKSSCNLNYLVTELKESLEKVKELEGKNDVELRLSYDQDRLISIFTDCHRLRQVLVNLIYNAIKFTHKGYIDFGYKIMDDSEILFHVKDTGIGIPEEMKDKIFERFHKDETSVKKSYGGAGLGLAISSQLVKLLGGEIWVESAVGEGTSFYFTIPYIGSKAKKAQKTSEESHSIEINWESKKLLIVEDDSFSTELITEFLSKTRANILFADNGRKAVDIFSENTDIDLIIMDIRLPELSGIEATLEIRKQNPDIPVVAQTAFAMEEDRLMAKTAGFNEFMVKPLNRNEFLNTLRKYLGDS